jgi:hypothetical protein
MWIEEGRSTISTRNPAAVLWFSVQTSAGSIGE